jgi:hypothetical protein
VLAQRFKYFLLAVIPFGHCASDTCNSHSVYFSFARFLIPEEWFLLRLSAPWFAGHALVVIARADAIAVETDEGSRIAADEPAETQINRADWIPDL